jgi:hypothetical protein
MHWERLPKDCAEAQLPRKYTLAKTLQLKGQTAEHSYAYVQWCKNCTGADSEKNLAAAAQAGMTSSDLDDDNDPSEEENEPDNTQVSTTAVARVEHTLLPCVIVPADTFSCHICGAIGSCTRYDTCILCDKPVCRRPQIGVSRFCVKSVALWDFGHTTSTGGSKQLTLVARTDVPDAVIEVPQGYAMRIVECVGACVSTVCVCIVGTR